MEQRLQHEVLQRDVAASRRCQLPEHGIRQGHQLPAQHAHVDAQRGDGLSAVQPRVQERPRAGKTRHPARVLSSEGAQPQEFGGPKWNGQRVRLPSGIIIIRVVLLLFSNQTESTCGTRCTCSGRASFFQVASRRRNLRIGEFLCPLHPSRLQSRVLGSQKLACPL